MTPKCTFTGVDDATPLEALISLSEAYPGVPEWGVLYSGSNRFGGRYPTPDRISEIAVLSKERCQTVRFALHVCGKAVFDLLAGKGHVSEVVEAFPRVQLNFVASDINMDALSDLFSRLKWQTIITQHNSSNAGVWLKLRARANHAILFDESRGCGVMPHVWNGAVPGIVCGYAGGLGPDNLAECLPEIHEAAHGRNHWVDMESSLRDKNDFFDLKKVECCLEIFEHFSQQQAAA